MEDESEIDDESEIEIVDDLFGEFNHDDFLEFERIDKKLSQRPDLHAFLLLDSLFPGTHDMVSGAEHDEIYLDVDPEELRKIATKDQLRDLHRCGVRYDSSVGALCMFA